MVYAFLAGCIEKPSKPSLGRGIPARNVVLIVIDTLRAGHLGSYGYSRDTSPFLDGLAAQGVVFERALSSSSFTKESVTSLLTGMRPSRSGGLGWGAVPRQDLDTLGEYFSRAGYRTAFFSNNPTLGSPEFAQGFDVATVSDKDWRRSGGGPELARRVIEFAQGARDEPFFVYAHFLDPHAPYEPADDYYLRFAAERFPRPLALYTTVRRRLRRLLAKGFGPGDPRFEDLMLRYDAEIASIDAAVEQLYQGLEQAGLAKMTLLVITADHGEEFLEHGYIDHRWTLYDEVLHVPLIFFARGAVPGRVTEGVSLVDLLPSLLTIQGIPYPQEDLDGRSLFRRESGDLVAEPEPRTRIAELLIADRNQMRALIRGRWKYIATLNWVSRFDRVGLSHSRRPTSDHEIWRPPLREELYDMVADPGEQNDVAAERTDLIVEFRSLVEAYRRLCREPNPRDLNDEEIERLRSLGYLE